MTDITLIVDTLRKQPGIGKMMDRVEEKATAINQFLSKRGIRVKEYERKMSGTEDGLVVVLEDGKRLFIKVDRADQEVLRDRQKLVEYSRILGSDIAVQPEISHEPSE